MLNHKRTHTEPKTPSLYLKSSSLETRNVGYSTESPDLPPVFLWPFVHLIPYLVLVAFSQIFSVGPPHIGHLKSFIYFHPNHCFFNFFVEVAFGYAFSPLGVAKNCLIISRSAFTVSMLLHRANKHSEAFKFLASINVFFVLFVVLDRLGCTRLLVYLVS